MILSCLRTSSRVNRAPPYKGLSLRQRAVHQDSGRHALAYQRPDHYRVTPKQNSDLVKESLCVCDARRTYRRQRLYL